MLYSFNIALCLLIFLALYANSQSTWNFVLRSAIDTIKWNKQIDKCDTYVTSGQTSTSAVWILNYTEPYNLVSIYSNTSAVGPTYGSDMRIVNYNSYGYYLFYATTSRLITVAKLSGSATTYAYDIGTPDYIRALYLDQDYPLMYYTGTSFLGVLNISNPTNAYKLAEFNTTQFLGQYTSSSMALASNYMYLAVMGTGSNNNPTKLRWDISDFGSRNLDVMFPLDYSRSYSVSIDPQNRYIGFRDSDGIKIFQISPPYRFLASVPYSSSSISVLFLGDYILTDNSSTNPFVIYKMVNGTMPPQGYQNISLQQENSVYSANLSGYYTPYGTRMYNSVLIAADTQGGTAISVSVTTDTGLNLTSLGQSLYYADSCHKRNGSPNFSLVFAASSPLIVDAQNLMPITNSQLLVTDMKKDVKWNYIIYAISAYSIPGMQFQYYDNTTKIWSNVSSFYQWDIFSGNVRLLPPYSFISTCQSGATVNAVVGNFTFTASDVWLRTLSSTLVNVAFVCCPSTNATVNATATINLINNSPSIATQYCNAVMPGYYTDPATKTIKACPLGTFNPNYGSVGLRNSCYSCPAGSTTTNLASTSWEDCQCSYCMLKRDQTYSVLPNVTNCAYMFRPQPLVQNPHKDRPLLFTTALMSASEGGIRFSFNSDSNGSSYKSASLETWLAASWNSQLIIRNQTCYSAFTKINYQYAFSGDIWTQSWSFYWKGYLAQGFIPLSYDASTDFTFRDEILSFFLNQNQSNIDPLYLKQNSWYQFAASTQPIRDIAYGCYGTTGNASYENSWVVAADDYINNQTVSTVPLTLASTFQTLGSGLSDNFAYTAIPASVLNVTSWFIFNTVPATWIDWTQNNFILSDNNPWKGLYYNLVLNNGDSNQNNWPLISSFTSQQMANSLVYIKILQNQTSFPASSFNISFQACHLWIRFCDFSVFNLTVNLPNFSANHIEISSWALLSGNNSNSTISFAGPLGTFSSTNNPGARNWSQIAFVPPNSIYLYGGTSQASSVSLSDLWLFNLNNSTWAKIKDNGASFTGKASAKGVASLSNWPASTSFGSLVYHKQLNILLLYGGSGMLNGSIWQYDLNTLFWSWTGGDLTAQVCNSSLYSSTAQPCPVSNFGEALVVSGQMYCTMGYLNMANALQNAAWQFNSSSYSFNLLNSATSGLNISSSSINPKTMYGSARQNEYQTNANVPGSAFIYQFGGQNSTSGASGNAVWIFDTVLNSFKQLSADLNISQQMLSSVSLGVETLVPFYPRARSASVADIFGNIWIYGGLASGNAALLNDLWIYNTVAESYQWVSGTNQLASITSKNVRASGLFALVGSAYSGNVPPAVTVPGSLSISYSTSNNRSITLYLIVTGGNYFENMGTQIWSLNAFILPSYPVVTVGSTIVFDILQTPQVYLNQSFFKLRDYDTPAYQLLVALTDPTKGYFQSATNGANITYVTYEMIQSGLQAYFVPSKYLGSGTFSVPFTVTDQNSNTVSNSFTMNIACVDPNVNSLNCMCNPGYYTNSNTCSACPVNTYKATTSNDTSCLPCPVGSSSNAATGLLNIDSCVALPGWYKQSSINYTCAIGYGYTSNNASCTACPINTYKDATNMYSCYSCPQGSHTAGNIGQTGISNCSALPGWYKQSSTNYTCALGYGYTSNNASCTACPINTYKDATNMYSCYSCPQGSYSNGGTGLLNIDSCVALPGWYKQSSINYTCATGYGYTSNNASCTACPINTYKDATNMYSCYSCPQGSYTAGNIGQTSISNCSALSGWYKQNSANYTCALGYGYTSTNASCTACPINTYKDATNMYSCYSCPQGSYTTGNIGQTSVSNCSALPGWYKQSSTNYTCALGYGYTSNNASCTACPINTYKDATNRYSCYSCPQGSYSNGATGVSNIDSCVALLGWYKQNSNNYTCAIGYGYTINNASCMICPINTYKNDTNLYTCSACPQGSYTNGTTGVSNIDSCISLSGWYKQNSNNYTCALGYGYAYTNISCTACPIDTYKDASNMYSCNSCPQGSYTNGTTGVSNIDSCISLSGWYKQNSNNYTCAIGYGYTSNNASCTACPTNTYKNDTDMYSCSACPQGTSTNGTTGQSGIGSCFKMPGWYELSPHNYTCALGYGYTENNASCTICAADSYKQFTNLDSCSICPIGSSTNGIVRSTSIANCTARTGFTKVNSSYYGCLQGYGYTANNSSCTICAENSYSFGQDLTPCILCPTGSSTSGYIGATNASSCQIRPSFVALQGAEAAYGCPAGSGLSSDNTSCVTCDTDSFQGSNALNTCKYCGTGKTTFSQSGMLQCWNSTEYSLSNSKIVCNPGFYASSSMCVPCAADTYKSTSSNDSCTVCNTGYSTDSQIASKSADACILISASSTNSSTAAGTSSVAVLGIALAIGSVVLLTLAVFGVTLMKRKRDGKKKVQNATSSNTAARATNYGGAQYIDGSPRVMPNLTRPSFSIYPVTNAQSNYDGRPISLQSNLFSQKTTGTTMIQRTGSMIARQSMTMAFPGFLLVESSSAFRKDERIAEGGFATLYRGRFFESSVVPQRLLQEDSNILNSVAIKVFKPASEINIPDAQQLADLENEATILYALMPLPNVVKLLAVSKVSDRAIVMKLYGDNFDTLIHGSSCSIRDDIVRAFNESWIQLAYCFACDLIEGVGGMHILGISHMDLKPANFLLEVIKNPSRNQGKYRLVISDFGLARKSQEYNRTKIGQQMTAGLSLRYAAPEAWNVARVLQKNFKVPDSIFKTIDSYSVSISIWEMLSRKHPLANVLQEEIEGAVLGGLRPSFDDLPTPSNAKEVEILKLCTGLLKEGFNANPCDRILVEDMKLEYVNPELFT